MTLRCCVKRIVQRIKILKSHFFFHPLPPASNSVKSQVDKHTPTEVVFPDLPLIRPIPLLNGSSYSHDHTHHRFIPFICQCWYSAAHKKYVKQFVNSRQNSQNWPKYGKIFRSLCYKSTPLAMVATIIIYA